jgi:hypothetical protein
MDEKINMIKLHNKTIARFLDEFSFEIVENLLLGNIVPRQLTTNVFS